MLCADVVTLLLLKSIRNKMSFFSISAPYFTQEITINASFQLNKISFLSSVCMSGVWPPTPSSGETGNKGEQLLQVLNSLSVHVTVPECCIDDQSQYKLSIVMDSASHLGLNFFFF